MNYSLRNFVLLFDLLWQWDLIVELPFLNQRFKRITLHEKMTFNQSKYNNSESILYDLGGNAASHDKTICLSVNIAGHFASDTYFSPIASEKLARFLRTNPQRKLSSVLPAALVAGIWFG